MTKRPEYDVVIVGGGMTGACFAIALAEQNVRIAVIEAVSIQSNNQPSYDDRGLALSISSRRILHGLGIWDQVSTSACPIQHVHVSDQNHFGFVRLHAEYLQQPALGYVVIARELGKVLDEKIKSRKNIDYLCPATIEDVIVDTSIVKVNLAQGNHRSVILGKVLVAADGAHSKIRAMLGIKTRIKDYEQTAIVSNVTPGKSHNNTAYERFTTHGPLALLPLTENRCALVFTVGNEQAETFMKMDEQQFLCQLQKRFGRRLGIFQRLGSRKTYPMQLITAQQQVLHRVVILGNSAHTIHPNGAQGFNLCLRDIAGLAETMIPVIQAGEDPGAGNYLENYLVLRAHDQVNVINFTDNLANLFYNELPHNVIARNAGMLLLDLFEPCKKVFTQKAAGIHGYQPALVRGTPLCP